MLPKLSRHLLVLGALASTAACSARWSAPALPPQSSSRQPSPSQPLSASSDLYVANASSNAIFVYQQGRDRPVRKITNGISSPFAMAEDRSSNLFVANAPGGKGGWVSVYAPGASRPMRTIATGIKTQWSIALAPSGELFVSSFQAGAIYEYARGAKSIERTITQGVAAPLDIAVDVAGYLYVSNCQHCLEPTPHNTLTLYAPKSEKLYRTIETSYKGPGQVAFDHSGNAYVDNNGSIDVYAGHSAKRIRTIKSAEGTLAFDAAGNLYSGQLKNFNSLGRVLVYPSGAGSPAYIIKKGIYDPEALTTDSAGNLYVANTHHNDIVVYASGSREPSRTITIATGLDAPQAIAFDSGANLYTANSSASTVTVYGPGSNTVLRTITAGVLTPMALAFDPDGNLYVANYYDNLYVIRMGSPSDTGAITVYAPLAADPFLTIRKGIHGWNYSLGFDRSQNLYVASGCYNHNNPISVYAHGSGSLLRTISQGVYFPCAITLDASGNLYVANYGSSTVAVFPTGASEPSRTINEGVDYPYALTLDHTGNLFVTNFSGGNKRRWGSVTVYPPGHAKPSRKITRGLNSGAGPYGSVLGPSGDLFVVDSPTKIVVYPRDGRVPVRTITQGLDGPTSLAFDPNGNLYVANLDSSTVAEYAAGTNKLIRTIPAVKGHPVALIFGSP
jgi:sugar lactone lactonase YvrE